MPATDRLIFWSGLVLVVLLFVSFGRANVAADSVDYYGMLQWITPEAEKPIVRNLYFAQQRSPGYSLTAAIPYFLLTIAVEPWVVTKQVVEYPHPDFLPGAKPPPERWGERPPRQPPHGTKISPPHPEGSEFFFIPPRPLLLWEVPFHDFFLPHEGSWLQWKLVLALALTSLLIHRVRELLEVLRTGRHLPPTAN